MRPRKKHETSDMVFALFLILIFAALLGFGVQVLRKARSSQKLCQSVVSLNKIQYDEDFLSEAAKIPGIRSVTPVLELAVRFRAGDYTMETTWLAADLELLDKKAAAAAPVSVGNVPVLLLGEKSLAGMVDSNGQTISEKKQKEYLSQFQEIEWQYQLAGTEESRQTVWLPCQVAAVLSEPEEGIYLSYGQGVSLVGLSASQSVSRILLTVQGEDNYEAALSYFVEK